MRKQKLHNREKRKPMKDQFNDDDDDDDDILFSTHEENNHSDEMVLSDDDASIEDSSIPIIHIAKPAQFFEIPLVRYGQELYMPLVYAKRFLNISSREIYSMYGRFEKLISLTERVCLNGNEMKVLSDLSKREGLDRSLHIKSNRNGISLFQIENLVKKVVKLQRDHNSQENADEENVHSNAESLLVPEDYSISSHLDLHHFILNVDNNIIESLNRNINRENPEETVEEESGEEIQSEGSDDDSYSTTSSLDDDNDNESNSVSNVKHTLSSVLEECDKKIIDTCPLHHDGVKKFQKLLVNLSKEKISNVFVPLDY
nr:unnamed protein product [Naegleria fowleri]